MPISTPPDLVSSYGDDSDHFEHVLRHLFEPALKRAGYDVTPPSVLNSQLIQAEIIRSLETADLVLCDISTWNANVFFELGIRVALDRPVALVKDNKTLTIPFDNALVSCHTYDAGITAWRLDEEVDALTPFIQAAGAQSRNALWKYFGITQRASAPAATNDPVQEKLDLILASLQLDPIKYTIETSDPGPLLTVDQLSHQMAQLTAREREVLVLLAQGLSNAELATRLDITALTVRTHLARVMAKLGVREKAQAVAAAYQSGLVQPGRPSG
jgi:DNA-binding CsgD family transcriptional regulator